MKIVDEQLIEELVADEEKRYDYLFLEEHDEFKGLWKVQSFDTEFFYDLRDIVGSHKTIAPAKLSEFVTAAEEMDYKVVFMDDPADILASYEALNEPPEFSLNTSFPNTVNGMLPFQLQGFNFLKNLRGGMAVHSTGTGKSRLASALINNHILNETTDLNIIVAKSHNLTNFQRSLVRDAEIESTVIDGTKERRQKLYAAANEAIEAGSAATIIINYEKWKFDFEEMLKLVDGRRVFILWDEMSAKLSNRDSALFKKIIECLYQTPHPYKGGPFTKKIRPSSLKQIATTATPIEVSPEGLYNCFRIMDPTILGTVEAFRAKYVRSYSHFGRQDRPEAWHQLDRLGLELDHVVHQVDKSDPDIAKMFPDTVHTQIYIDWNSKDRKIYDMLAKDAEKHGLDQENPLAVITVLQMLCDAPTIVKRSADEWEEFFADFEDTGDDSGRKGSVVAATLMESLEGRDLNNDSHTKLDALKELLTEKHKGEKAVVFAVFNAGLMPVLKDKFEEWGVTYVQYEGTAKERQAAQDAFMSDPDVQVFLSSDKGSDSLDLYEANIVINYDLPWNWSRLQQRVNRVHRIVSNHETVYYYDLLMADSVEDRKRELIKLKKGFHDGVFRGSLADRSISSRMSKDDLLYTLHGD